jgi:hypothetical protein
MQSAFDQAYNKYLSLGAGSKEIGEHEKQVEIKPEIFVDNDIWKAIHSYTGNRLVGGLGDNLTVDDLLYKFDINQILKGIQVEYEHTNDINLSLEIVMDHLCEISDYYDRLEKMEQEANSQQLAI